MRSRSLCLLAATTLGVVVPMVLASSCAQPSSSLAAGGDTPEEIVPDAGAGGSAGEGGSDQGQGAGGSGLNAGGVGGSEVQDAGADASTNPPFVEPDGPPSLMLLNGIVDRSSIRLCLVPWSGSSPITTTPASPTKAMEYGASVAGGLPAGYDPETTALRPLIVDGESGAASDCASLWSTPPEGVRVSALPVLPAGTFSAQRALLLIAAGCVGGGEGSSVLTCGQGATAANGNPTLVLAQLSRVAPPKDRIGLQVVQASAAMGRINVQAVAYATSSTRVVTSNLNLGQIAPRPPIFLDLSTTFGTPAKGGQLLVTNAQTGTYYGHFPLGPALAAGGLDESALAPGRGFVAVVLGPLPEASDAGLAPTEPRVVLLEAPVLP